MARQMVDVYAEFAVNGAAMPVIAGGFQVLVTLHGHLKKRLSMPCLAPFETSLSSLLQMRWLAALILNRARTQVRFWQRPTFGSGAVEGRPL